MRIRGQRAHAYCQHSKQLAILTDSSFPIPAPPPFYSSIPPLEVNTSVTGVELAVGQIFPRKGCKLVLIGRGPNNLPSLPSE